LIDASIPFKDRLLIELLRGAVLWIIWLERNRLCFNDSTPCSIKILGTKIISLTQFWCQSRGDDYFFKLNLIMPFDVKDLPDLLLLEEARSPEPIQALDLLVQGSGDGNPPSPMSGDEEDEDLLDL
jgi:hypothetical protein